MTERHLGIVIYPDGSQAEVLYVGCHPMHGSELVFRPLKKPRKLKRVFDE